MIHNSTQFSKDSINGSPFLLCHCRSLSYRKGKEVVGKDKEFVCGQDSMSNNY